MKDERIIELFFARSESAIAELADKYGRLCMRVAENVTGSREDSEECCNDAYLAAWNSIPPEHPKSLSAYLCRIVRNLALKKQSYNRADKRNSEYAASLDELFVSLTAEGSVDDDLTAAELSRAINGFLDRERGVDKELFVRRYYLCESVAAAAAAMSISTNKASVRLSRQRERLAAYLRKEGYTV